jgi:UPF0176 protein
MNYRVLLYYKYVPLSDPEQFLVQHRLLCQKLKLTGRILIADEGLNGTLAGTIEATEQYKQALWAMAEFKDIEFKEHLYHENPFAKLKIKYRKELVALGVEDIKADQATQHLLPEDWHALAAQPDAIVMDVRNNYESKIGKFKNAIVPDIANFRELPAWMAKHQELKDKKVLIYCTGGIRCEKASAVLKKSGVGEVYQLHGGIINYGKHIPDGLWEGSCFVFDQRMSVPVNDPEHHYPISHCQTCATKTDQYYNCANVECNALMLQCDTCRQRDRYCLECLPQFAAAVN